MGIRLANEEITLTLTPAQAQIIAAALKVFGTLAGGDPKEDPDTDATAESFDTYLNVMGQVYGGDPLWCDTTSGDVDSLANTLERDMLMIVHRNYTRTADGFVKK